MSLDHRLNAIEQFLQREDDELLYTPNEVTANLPSTPAREIQVALNILNRIVDEWFAEHLSIDQEVVLRRLHAYAPRHDWSVDLHFMPPESPAAPPPLDASS